MVFLLVTDMDNKLTAAVGRRLTCERLEQSPSNITRDESLFLLLPTNFLSLFLFDDFCPLFNYFTTDFASSSPSWHSIEHSVWIKVIETPIHLTFLLFKVCDAFFNAR